MASNKYICVGHGYLIQVILGISKYVNIKQRYTDEKEQTLHNENGNTLPQKSVGTPKLTNTSKGGCFSDTNISGKL